MHSCHLGHVYNSYVCILSANGGLQINLAHQFKHIDLGFIIVRKWCHTSAGSKGQTEVLASKVKTFLPTYSTQLDAYNMSWCYWSQCGADLNNLALFFYCILLSKLSPMKPLCVFMESDVPLFSPRAEILLHSIQFFVETCWLNLPVEPAIFISGKDTY